MKQSSAAQIGKKRIGCGDAALSITANPLWFAREELLGNKTGFCDGRGCGEVTGGIIFGRVAHHPTGWMDENHPRLDGSFGLLISLGLSALRSHF